MNVLVVFLCIGKNSIETGLYIHAKECTAKGSKGCEAIRC
ncbi:Uncharacterised protein [Segatella copri]|nr:Uncharacterised protein [Segatella copri]